MTNYRGIYPAEGDAQPARRVARGLEHGGAHEPLHHHQTAVSRKGPRGSAKQIPHHGGTITNG